MEPRPEQVRPPGSFEGHQLLDLGRIAVVADAAMPHLEVTVDGVGVVGVGLERLHQERLALVELALLLLQHAQSDVAGR